MWGWVRRALVSNLVLKLLSLALAVLLFVVVHSEKQSTAHGTVSVSYMVPSGKVLATKPPAALRITISGSVSRLQRYRLEELGTVSIDLSTAKDGYFKFRDDLLALPAGLKVTSIRPEGFLLRFEPTYRRAVTVRLEVDGEPAAGFRVNGRVIRPPRVMVSGPRRLVSSLAALPTEPLSLDGARQSLREKVAVLAPPGVQKVEPDSVEVSIAIGPVLSQTSTKEQRPGPTVRHGQRDAHAP